MPLGEKVRLARQQSGMTTQALAEKTGISQPYISEIENGHKTPSTRTLIRLADTLNVNAEFLLRDDVVAVDELGLPATIQKKIDSSKYFPYFVTVDNAISVGVTPEEMLDLLNFIEKIRRAQ